MGLCQDVDLCFHALSLPCLHAFWHAIPTSFYIFNVFFKSCSILVLNRLLATYSILSVVLWSQTLTLTQGLGGGGGKGESLVFELVLTSPGISGGNELTISGHACV